MILVLSLMAICNATIVQEGTDKKHVVKKKKKSQRKSCSEHKKEKIEMGSKLMIYEKWKEYPKSFQVLK